MNAIIEHKSSDVSRFELMQREARMFAISPLVPAHLRQGGEQAALANCYIALTMAKAMNENPIMVLQNIHVINGKAGWSSQYMIARANASGVFTGRIGYDVKGSGDSLVVTAHGTLEETGQRVEVSVSMEMAKAEGWTKNPKYKSMPEIMLRYRAAAFLVRFYAPEVMMGYQTSEEIEDISASSMPMAETAKTLTAQAIIAQAGEADADASGVEDAVVEEANDPDEQAVTGGPDIPDVSDEDERQPADLEEVLGSFIVAGSKDELSGLLREYDLMDGRKWQLGAYQADDARAIVEGYRDALDRLNRPVEKPPPAHVDDQSDFQESPI